jgi:hypothetical protein
VIYQRFSSKVLMARVTACLEVRGCFGTVMSVNIASGDKKPSPVFLNVGKILLDTSLEW